jgi:hypothetical protein
MPLCLDIAADIARRSREFANSRLFIESQFLTEMKLRLHTSFAPALSTKRPHPQSSKSMSEYLRQQSPMADAFSTL